MPLRSLSRFVQSVKKNKENHFRCLSRQSRHPVSHKLYAVGVYECSEMSWVEGSG